MEFRNEIPQLLYYVPVRGHKTVDNLIMFRLIECKWRKLGVSSGHSIHENKGKTCTLLTPFPQFIGRVPVSVLYLVLLNRSNGSQNW